MCDKTKQPEKGNLNEKGNSDCKYDHDCKNCPLKIAFEKKQLSNDKRNS